VLGRILGEYEHLVISWGALVLDGASVTGGRGWEIGQMLTYEILAQVGFMRLRWRRWWLRIWWRGMTLSW